MERVGAILLLARSLAFFPSTGRGRRTCSVLGAPSVAVDGVRRKLRLPGLRRGALAKASPEHDLGTMHPLDSLPAPPA